MSKLQDNIMSDLFVAIINLIYFICHNAFKHDLNKHFSDLAESLDLQGREQLLFNCLNMPDDKVRNAVVKCLSVVPLDQLDEQEIECLVKTISECNNISAGETELVLANIYQICFKFLDKDVQNKECSKIF